MKIQNLECSDCGRKPCLISNVIRSDEQDFGWYFVDSYVLCPTCRRLMICEKALHNLSVNKVVSK